MRHYLRVCCFFFFSSRRRHTRLQGDWSSDVCSSDLSGPRVFRAHRMRRILLDENLPRKLRREFPSFVVRTVQEEGWTSLANGALLGRAQQSFDVLLTADRRLQFQQNVPQFNIGVVVVIT